MKQQMRSYILGGGCNKAVAAVNTIRWRIKVSLSTRIHK
jgi:hypothetical protein